MDCPDGSVVRVERAQLTAAGRLQASVRAKKQTLAPAADSADAVPFEVAPGARARIVSG